MEFKNGYNFLYQKMKDIYASKIGRPGPDDSQVSLGITPEELENVKLVYETADSLVVSFKNIPTTNDIPIELTANGEEVIGPSAGEARVLVPFEIGMSIRGYDFGNVKNGDINLELDQYLLSLPERETLILVGSSNEGAGLFAVNYQGQAFIYTFLGGGSGEPTLYYSTVEGDIGEFYAKRGYQNLDDTGRVYSASYTVDVLNQGIEDSSWNGKFIGAIVDSRPTRFIPLKKGDKFVNVHFDTTLTPTYADFYLSRQADHIYVGIAGTWDWYYNGSTEQDIFACWYYEAGAKVDTPAGQVVLEKPMFMIMSINSTLVFYADENAVEYFKLFGVNINPGWQGATLKEVAQKFEVEEYLLPDAYGELVNNILGPDYTGAWNGRFIGFTENDYYVEPPVSIDAFETDMLLVNIPNMHFEANKKANILNMLPSLTYSQAMGANICKLILADSGNIHNLAVLSAITVPEDDFYGLIILNMASDPGMIPILGNKEYTWHFVPNPGYEYDIVFTGEFQNLDGDNNSDTCQHLAEMMGDTAFISAIDNTGDWNGNFIGIANE